MQMLKLISSMVFMVQPMCALFRMFGRLTAALVCYARPSGMLTRACYVLLGITLLLGALGAERDGQRRYAIALAAAGAILLMLRRGVKAKSGKRANIQDEPPLAQPKFNGARNIVVVSPDDGVELCRRPSKISAPVREPSPPPAARDMPSDLLKLGWSRKRLAVNSAGLLEMPDSPAAVAWSLCGAMNAVYKTGTPSWKSYMSALQTQVGQDLVGWNGNSNRTQEEVVAVAMEAERNV